jgi:UDP-N-acetylglucosamine 2-epimerase (non-hydrolysing)
VTAVLLVVGTRPNFMKVAPVYTALGVVAPDVRLVLVHTGQHYDEQMSTVFFGELGMPEPDVFLGVGSGSHAEQTARALTGIEGVIEAERPDLVVVAGDVNSTLAGALAAVKLNVPVAHLEAGLRSYDRTMPEEHNRRLTDAISSVLLTHSEEALGNLSREGVDPATVHLVGNTMIDSLLEHLPRALAREPWKRLGLPESRYALVTLHRPGLVDDPDLLRETMAQLHALSRTVPVVFPVHPRTRHRIEQRAEQEPDDSGLLLIEPLGYLDFLGLEARAQLVLTDSGGVQEETSALGIPCFTLRETTERPVTVRLGTNTMLGLDPSKIATVAGAAVKPAPAEPIPFWDGNAGIRAAGALVDFLRGRDA